jgi:RimJ/RimL family protein N-acetyltransferase
MSRLRILREDAPEVIETEHLRLVVSDPVWAPKFAEALRASTDELRFIPGWRKAGDVEYAASSLRRSIESARDDIVRHAFERVTNDYVGRIDLHSWDDDVPRCEIGYLGATRMTGRGLLTEACRAMMDLAWSMGVIRIQATCDARNARAIRMAERLGMLHEGVRLSYERDVDGTLCDEVMLAIVRDPTSNG